MQKNDLVLLTKGVADQKDRDQLAVLLGCLGYTNRTIKQFVKRDRTVTIIPDGELFLEKEQIIAIINFLNNMSG